MFSRGVLYKNWSDFIKMSQQSLFKKLVSFSKGVFQGRGSAITTHVCTVWILKVKFMKYSEVKKIQTSWRYTSFSFRHSTCSKGGYWVGSDGVFACFHGCWRDILPAQLWHTILNSMKVHSVQCVDRDLHSFTAMGMHVEGMQHIAKAWRSPYGCGHGPSIPCLHVSPWS